MMLKGICAIAAVFIIQVGSLNIVLNNLDADIAVSENTTIGTVLFMINATDLDVGDVLNYTSNYTYPAMGPFLVDDSTGYITLDSPGLDYETATWYLVGISVTDGNTTEDGVLNVTVIDYNDPPIISVPADIIIDENVTTSAVIYTATAVDPEGEDVNITCSVTPDDDTFQCERGGNVSYIDDPDFRYHHYVITITATAATLESSSVELIVNITEYVDNPPYFEFLPNTTVVLEGVPVGTVLYQVGARDEEGQPVTLNFTVVPPTEYDTFNFTVDGMIILAQPLDYETLPVYTIDVMACDPQQCTNYTSLDIIVADYAEAPVVTVAQATVNMPEDATPNVYQLSGVKFNVSDPDGDTNFEYLLPSYGHNSYFRIDPDSGNLTLKKEVDYEDTATFPDHQMILRVGVRDPSGAIGYVDVTVDIDDVDEYSPVFNPKRYAGTVVENSPYGTSVLTVSAPDGDGGKYGSVRYWVDSVGSPYFKVVTLSNGDGHLQVLSPIDKEQYLSGKISFTIYSTDGVTRDEAQVTLTILDENDSPPVFQEAEFYFTVRHDASAGTYVGQVKAYDPDSSAGRVTYTVSSNSTLFLVTWMDGQIVVRASGSLQPDTTYTFTAYAEDGGNGEQSEVLVHITTFRPQKLLVDWEIETDEYMGPDDVAQFEADLAETCTPCDPQVVEYFKDPDTGNWIFRVHIPGWTKQQQLDRYTSDGRRRPTDESAALAPSGDVISINESFADEDENWWLDTPEGNFVVALLCLMGAGLLSTGVVALLDYVWWSRKAERRSFFDGPDQDPPKQQRSVTPPPDSNMPGTPQGTP